MIVDSSAVTKLRDAKCDLVVMGTTVRAGLQNAGKDLNADTFVTGLEAVKNYKDISAPRR